MYPQNLLFSIEIVKAGGKVDKPLSKDGLVFVPQDEFGEVASRQPLVPRHVQQLHRNMRDELEYKEKVARQQAERQSYTAVTKLWFANSYLLNNKSYPNYLP